MEIQVNPKADDLQLTKIIKGAEPGATLNTENEYQFELIKRLLVQYKRVGLRVCLLDEDGYITRQISSRMREEHAQAGFNDKQLSVIKALERVLSHCRQEGISLIGYSDELVAVPSILLHNDLGSEQSLEIEDRGVYLGADSLKSSSP